MFKTLLILLTITCLSMAGAWIADEPGRVVIDWGNYHIETSLLVMLSGVALAALCCMIAYYALYALVLSPRNWLRSRLAKRQALGLEALTGAFTAIATQDIRLARKQIKRAQQYLPHQPLTLMLASQVARLEGNESQSRLYLEQMLKSGSTEFMALRGLIESARRNHHTDTALAHGEKALTLKPQDPWLVTTLAGLYAQKQRTQDALSLLANAARKRVINRQEQRVLSAGVLYEHARSLADSRRFELAIAALRDALRDQPALTPASALLAECYREQGDMPRALNVIAAAWKAAPHPLLAHALLECIQSDTARAKALRRAEKMARMHPQNRETRFLLAAVALQMGDTAQARNEGELLIQDRETDRACSLMAQVEGACGESVRAADWLKRSHAAPHDPGYVCEQCHRPSGEWRLTCPHCGSVASLEWK